MIGTDNRVDARQLAERMRSEDRALAALEAGFIDDVITGLHGSVWTHDGHLSINAWLRATTRWSDARIGRCVRNARLCRDAPAVLDALREGRITIDRVDVLGRAHANPRVRDQLVGYVDDFIDHAAGVPHRVFELMVRNWVNYIDLDGAHHDAEQADNARHLTISTSDDGTMTFHGQLSGARAVQFRNVLDAYTHAEFLTDRADAIAAHGDTYTKDQLARTHRQRVLDALLHITHDAATHATHTCTTTSPTNATGDTDDGDIPAAAPAAGTPVPVKVPDTIIHADITSLTKLIELLQPSPEATLALHGIGSLTLQELNAELATCLDPARLHMHTGDGHPIAPAELLTALILGKLRLVIEDEAGVITHAGRSRRLFTGTQRDLVLAASIHCVFAGCDRPATRCQADHLQPHSHNGPTNTDNGAPCCTHHNPWRHQHHYRITRDTHGHWHTWRPDGTEL